MSNYPQYFLATAIAAEGDKTVPPVDSQTAGTGRLSQEKGWTEVNAQAISEGGIPPKREDFNGVLFLLSQFLIWFQQGGIMEYSTSLDYEPTNEVFSAGVKYRCLIANGPNTEKGLVSPGSDKSVWASRDAPSVLAGQVAPFANCSVGGSDGRRLIPWGSTEANESYVLCDGGSDGHGGSVPNLIGRFVLPSTIAEAGQTGGAESATTSTEAISGTVGETTLTLDQIPAHSHTGTTATAGGHTHTRGSMNITGTFGAGGQDRNTQTTGAFYPTDGNQNVADDGNTNAIVVGFDASRNWTGETSNNGAHSHSMNLNSSGGGQPHTHTLSGDSHSHTITVPKPLFYKLAYFVKLPE